MSIAELRTGEKVAGASGILLFIFMFFFKWFGVDVEGFGGGGSVNAWNAFSIINWVLLLTVIAAVALPVISLTQARLDLPVALSAIVALLGIISVILILFRIISPPDLVADTFDIGFGAIDNPGFDTTRKLGVFLGLLAAIGTAIGGWLAMQEEGTSFTEQRDRVGSRGGGPGAGGPPPPGGSAGGGTATPPPAPRETPPGAGTGGTPPPPPPPPPPSSGA